MPYVNSEPEKTRARSTTAPPRTSPARSGRGVKAAGLVRGERQSISSKITSADRSTLSLQKKTLNKRTVLSLFAKGAVGRAMGGLKQMNRSSPHVTQSIVSQLVERRQISEALQAWTIYWMSRNRPAPNRDAELKLLDALTKGWSTQRLEGTKHYVDFHKPLRVTVRKRADEDFECRVFECEMSGQGKSMLEAIDNTVRLIRERAETLHRQLTHTLSEKDQRTKRLLLGRVNIVSSGLIDRVRPTRWIPGRLEQRQDGTVTFRTFGVRARDYSLSPELLASAGQIGSYLFAKVPTGQAGEPLGPVLEFKAD